MVLLLSVALLIVSLFCLTSNLVHLLHKCPNCQKDCCVNPPKADPAAGCQTDPAPKNDGDDKPTSACCGGGGCDSK